MLSTHHLVFLEVARQRSFSRASQVLFISQPAISKHIKLLESYYKCRLFERKGIQIQITPAGKLLMDRVMQVKNIQEETEFQITAIGNETEARGILKLGASTTVALYILPRILSVFHKKYPQLEISLLNRNSEIVLAALLDQEINLGIVEQRSKLINVVYHPFISDKVIAVCNKNSPIAKKKSYPLRSILDMPVALRERGSGTLDALQFSLAKQKISLNQLNVKVRLGGTEALKNFLVESECLGFLPRRSVLKELAGKELTEIHFEGINIERNFYFIQRKGESSELTKTFIKIAKDSHNLKL
ncbi:MAG: LysR family transcriptional regulator [Chitinophagaceae bacterium]|nr:MAG: LysR family transcriptional regulator [Chitinophagaceae bacterium]